MSPYLLRKIAYLLPWLLWLLTSSFWYLWFGFTTFMQMLGRLSEHWFLVALLVAVYLMAAGRVGAAWGIPMLFRDEFRDDLAVGFNWKSPALWGAFGMTALIGEVFIVIYLYEYIENYHWLDPGSRQEGWDHLKLWAAPSQNLGEFRDYRSALEFLVASTPPFLTLLLLIAAFPVGSLRSLRGFDLRLISAVKDADDVPTEGANLVFVTTVGQVLHFRVFDRDEEMVVDTDERQLTGQAARIEGLRKLLGDLWFPHELTRSEKDRVLYAVESIVGHDFLRGPKSSLRRAIDVLKYLLGMLAGGVAVAAMVWVGWSLALHAERIRLVRWGIVISFSLLRTWELKQTAGLEMAIAVTAAFCSFLAVVFLGGAAMNWMITKMRRSIAAKQGNGPSKKSKNADELARLAPSLGLSMLFGLIVAFYFVLVSLQPFLRIVFLLLLVAWAAWSNSGAYKYQLPGMGTVNGESLYKAKLVPVNSSPVVIPGPQKPLLDSFDVLNAWKDHLFVGFDLQLMSSLNGVSGIPTEGKNLIILAVVDQVLYFRIYDGVGQMVVNTDEKSLTGQAGRIKDLRKQLQGLWPPHELTRSEKDRVIAEVTSIAFRPKLVMVAVTGGAYRAGFWTAAVLDELDYLSRTDPNLKGLTDHIRLITGASGGMVGASYFAALRGQPNASVVDRIIHDTFRDSLTPVIQQMVLHDIPMILIPTPHQKRDRGIVLEREWETIAIPFSKLYEDEKRGQCPSLIVSPMVIETGERMLISNLDLRHLVLPHSAGGEPYLRSAREFFRMFPEAQPEFRLQTAVRLSATFPYVSPAVSLPTNRPRRLVDAGYYDNYGVNLAVAWAYQNRDWIRDNTSGLALIQIYSYPRRGISADEPGSVEAGPGSASRGFQWLSSPIEGALGARDWSMLYRNDEQLRLLDDTFNLPGDQGRMFDTFSFEYRGDAAMNWMITERDIDKMRRSIAAKQGNGPSKKSKNADELARLADWWKGRPIALPKRMITAPDQPQGIKFRLSSALTQDVQEKLNELVYRFRVYLHRLGYTPKRGWIKVKDSLSEQLNWRYDVLSHTIVFDKKLAEEYDGMTHTYVHEILFENDRSTWKQECLQGLGEGLSDYFPCSFKNSPNFGERFVEIQNKIKPGYFTKPYLRTMDNSHRFDQLGNDPESPEEREVWGGAFWELRQGLGKDAQGNYLADVLLLRTAMSLTPPGAGTEARSDFVRQLLEQEHRVTGGRVASRIQHVFRGRRVKL